MNDWMIFKGLGEPADGDPIKEMLPLSPRWRRFDDQRGRRRGMTFRPSKSEWDQTLVMVNAALYLRRPLLVTGNPGTGKSSLAYAIAEELKLGDVLKWPINTRTSVQDGLYRYDALARLRGTLPAANAVLQGESGTDTAQEVGRYIRLGPLGTALLPSDRPRVLLIDEIDKGDVDLPNDLLHIFEEGEFPIPEITRLLPKDDAPRSSDSAPMDLTPIYVQTHEDQQEAVSKGYVRCTTFPIVIMTSNAERDFPPAFLRRCLRLDIQPPTEEDLAEIVAAHFKDESADEADITFDEAARYIKEFIAAREQTKGNLATDQLLNLIYVLLQMSNESSSVEQIVKRALLRSLG